MEKGRISKLKRLQVTKFKPPIPSNSFKTLKGGY